MKINDIPIILASASPRRRELLEMLGVDRMCVRPARGGEMPHPELSPAELVKELSRAKAAEVSASAQESLVIAADTVVYAAGQVLGKPADTEDARRMLDLLSGREHEVYTGLTLFWKGRQRQASECTAVRFRTLDVAEIEAYIATGEPMDKAGAYGIQGKASLFIEGITGDYFNVMGLPLCALGKLLKEMDIELL